MLSKKSPGIGRRYAGLALTGAVVLTGLAFTASGEGMAAQVGAKVSEALPIPRKVDFLPSLPTVPAAHAALQADKAAARADQLALAADDAARTAEEARRTADAQASLVPPTPPAPPAPPVPPAPGVAVPTSPAPPPPPPVASREVRKYRHVVRVGEGGHVSGVPTDEEIEAMVPIVEVTEGSGCGGAREFVNTSEQTVSVDGKMRKKIAIRICGKDIGEHARAEAIRGMEEARADIARERDLSAELRNKIVGDLDRQIASMRAGKD